MSNLITRKKPDIVMLENEMVKVSSKLTYESSPFYANVLMQCSRVWSYEVPTLCVTVTRQVLLIINPDYFMGIAKVQDKKTGKEIEVGCKNILERLGCVEHELLHLILYHLSRGTRLSDKKIGGLAADMVVNQYVRFKLTGDYIKHDRYNLPAEKDLDWYYNALREMQKENQDNADKSQQQQQGGGKGKKSQSSGGGQLQNDVNDDFSSSENGRGSHDGWNEQSEEAKEQNEVLKKCGIEDGGISEGAKEAIVTDVVRQAANKDPDSLSKLPGSIAGFVQEMLKPKQSTQPWNVILRRFLGTHGSSMLRSSIKYSSKRFRDPISGAKMRPGLRVKRQKKILFAIDTSGSMTKKDLELCAGELSAIWRYNKDITVAECDTEIHKIYKFNGRLESVCGRGGTDMMPIRNLFEEGDYDCCVLLTDGQIGEIGERAPRKGWLWVITHGGDEPCEWGSYIHLPDADTVAYQD